MGFLKDLSTLNKVGKEARKNWDPAAQMAQAQASLAQTNAMMMDMTARVSSTTGVHGTPTTATVMAARQTGAYVNMQPMVAIDLLVQMPGGMPSPVTLTEIVSQLHLARLTVGSSLPVKVGATPHDVVIDWFSAS